MRVLVLGANGYLGRKLISYLSCSYDITGAYRVIPSVPQTGLTKQIEADIDSVCRELQQNCYEWVINCTGIYERAGVKMSQLADANLIFAFYVLDCAIECGVKNFLTIDTSLPKWLNFYSFTKKQFAELGKFYALKYKITFVNVLLEMFYGEDEPRDRFLPSSCKKMVTGGGRTVLRLTEGTQKRDIIHIDDVCHAIKLLLESSITGFCNVPLGSGEAVAVRDLVKYMHKVTESQTILDFGSIPMRENEPDCVADLTLLRSIGFKPCYSWQQGLEKLCRRIEEEEGVSCAETHKQGGNYD